MAALAGLQGRSFVRFVTGRALVSTKHGLFGDLVVAARTSRDCDERLFVTAMAFEALVRVRELVVMNGAIFFVTFDA
jgi:hypothetical protein